MRYLSLMIIALLFCSCKSNNIEIEGVASGADGGIVTIQDAVGTSLLNQVIKGGKFTAKQLMLPANGYYTLSVQEGNHPRDFEIYLEPGKYNIEVPKEEDRYVKIQTQSIMQQELTAYYNMENEMGQKIRRENAIWVAKMKNSKSDQLTDKEFNFILERVESGRRREYGLHIAAMDMFIKKYPDNIIIPHIISNMDYKRDPMPYLMLYNKLGSAAKNSSEGRQIGLTLQALAKN
ncbi:hypothetical protein [Mucilaginibacter auburnensis]|uniref:DUF4369 domain-containing protein n=1 Tax=Mucilaginibacter auburnensis TaxID=1457233 RepID=A0A2H9VUK8_9SPHI|nr:hypothetical protein [Mucilaginibacter auburnensis]PJJ84495.1 hypothetical protein CLV57_1508 [Mucilaginibacter auburnensis]